MNGFEDTA